MNFVYFVRCAGHIKIGTSGDEASGRVDAVIRGCPPGAVLVGAISGDRNTEKAIHAMLHPHRRGGEWFEDCPAVVEAIEALLHKGAINLCPPPKPAKIEHVFQMPPNPWPAIWRSLNETFDDFTPAICRMGPTAARAAAFQVLYSTIDDVQTLSDIALAQEKVRALRSELSRLTA